jgi:hypothetical protein
MKSDREIAMAKAKLGNDERGASIVIIPKYIYNTDLHCFEEDETSKPSDKLYLKIGYNDLQVVTEMENGNDLEKRKQKTQARSEGFSK